MTDEVLPLRLLGVGASNLTREGMVQGQLFEDEEQKRGEVLDRTIDAIRNRLGPGAIRRGSLIDPPALEVGQDPRHGNPA